MNRPSRRTAWTLAGVGVLMLGFGYALVPLYDVLCDLTGFSGRTSNLQQPSAVVEAPASDRRVTVQFATAVNRSMPWDFRPAQFEMEVEPGRVYRTVFHARNRTERLMTGQAVPSITPPAAALHFVKQECFCFLNQPLEPGASAELPLVFQVSRNLPARVDTLTLSYTFFDVSHTSLAPDPARRS